MLTALLSLAGVAGVGGIGALAFLYPPFGGLLLGAGRAAVGAASKVPLKVWYALAAIALLVGGYFYHQQEAHKALNAAYQRGIAAEAAHVEKQALAIKAKADTLNAGIASAIRSKNDEETRRIHADAGNLRLLGPGKATCASRTGLSATAGGPIASGSGPDVAGPALPPADFAAVPWNWLVGRSEEHDVDRTEILSWREWYQKLLAAWPKSTPAK